MAIIIEAPNEVHSLENYNNLKMFLAGGITNCPDWQSYVINELKDLDGLTIYNPRRKNFPINNPKASEEQIIWEFNHLRDADFLFFWFSKGSLNPIVLYELGMWVNSSDVPTFVGVDPQYERKQDVYIQTKLARPDLIIHDSIEEMIEKINEMFNEIKYNQNNLL